MKIIYNHIIPLKGYSAINICGILFARRELTAIEINHEEIHTMQIKKYYYICFYVMYLYYWVVNGFNYMKIPFEIEAYENETNLNYLNK
jgi:hypothetical protein